MGGPDVTDRGTLLWEEEARSVESTRSMYLLAAKFLIIAPLTLVPILFMSGPSTLPLAAGLLAVVLGSFLALYLYVTRAVRRRLPLRIYAGGFTEAAIDGGEHFVPWAAASGWEETAPEELARLGIEDVEDKELVVRGVGKKARKIPSSIEGYAEVKRAVEAGVGKGLPAPGWFDAAVRRRLARYALGIVPLSIGMGALLSVLVFLFGGRVFGDGPAAFLLSSLLLSLVMFGAFMLTWTYDCWAVPRGAFPHLAALGGVALLLLAATAAVAFVGPAAVDYQPDVWERSDPGDSVITMGEHRGEVLNLTGPVTVRAGESLLLDGCTINFYLVEDGIFGIWVAQGGELVMRNTTVGSLDDHARPLVEVHGRARIEGCAFDRLGGYRPHPNGEGGLKLFSDDVVVSGTSITRPWTNGILTSGCSPAIVGCTIVDAWDDAIECTGGAPAITGCTIRDSGFAIMLRDCDARIAGCNISGCGEGVCAWRSSPTVSGCTITGTRDEAVWYDDFSGPRLTNLTMSDNGAGVVHARWTDTRAHPLVAQLGGLCLPAYVLVGALSVLPFAVRARSLQRGGGRRPEWAGPGDSIRRDASGPGGRPGAETAPPPAPSLRDRPAGPLPAGRGALLHWAPASLRNSPLTRIRSFWPLLLPGVPVLAFLAYAAAVPLDGLALYFVGSMLGMFLLLVGILWIGHKRTYVCAEVYERGVAYQRPVGTRFLPWSELDRGYTVTLRRGPPELTLESDVLIVRVPTRFPGYSEVDSLATERAGKAEYSGRDPGDTTRREFAAQLLGVVLAWAITGAIVIHFAFRDGVGAPHLAHWKAYGLAALVAGLIGFPFFVGWLSRFLEWPRFGVTLPRLLAVGVALGAVFYGSVGAVVWTDYAELFQDPTEADMSDDPGPSWLPPGDYEGRTLSAEGPVSVHAGEVLRVFNSTITFRPAPGNDYGVWVGPGGRLVLVNTTVTSDFPQVGFSFEVHGSALVEGCTVVGTSHPSDYQLLDSGVEVYSDDVVLRNTTLEGANGRAVCVFRCSPVIEGCTVSNASRSGIWVCAGEPTLAGCTVSGCSYGISLEDCAPTVSGCVLRDNDIGVKLDYSDATVRGCSFSGNVNGSVSYQDERGSPVLEDNTFDAGSPGVVVLGIEGDKALMLFILYMMPTMVLIFSAHSGIKRRRERREGRSKELEVQMEALEGGLEGKAVRGPVRTTMKMEGERAMVTCPSCGGTIDLDARYSRTEGVARCGGCGLALKFKGPDD